MSSGNGDRFMTQKDAREMEGRISAAIGTGFDKLRAELREMYVTKDTCSGNHAHLQPDDIAAIIRRDWTDRILTAAVTGLVVALATAAVMSLFG